MEKSASRNGLFFKQKDQSGKPVQTEGRVLYMSLERADIRAMTRNSFPNKRKEGKQSDEQTCEQTEQASYLAFTQTGKRRAVPLAICDVTLLDAVLCG